MKSREVEVTGSGENTSIFYCYSQNGGWLNIWDIDGPWSSDFKFIQWRLDLEKENHRSYISYIYLLSACDIKLSTVSIELKERSQTSDLLIKFINCLHRVERKDHSIQIYELFIYDIKFIYCLWVEWKKKIRLTNWRFWHQIYFLSGSSKKAQLYSKEREIAPKKLNISHHCTLSDRFVAIYLERKIRYSWVVWQCINRRVQIQNRS